MAGLVSTARGVVVSIHRTGRGGGVARVPFALDRQSTAKYEVAILGYLHTPSPRGAPRKGQPHKSTVQAAVGGHHLMPHTGMGRNRSWVPLLHFLPTESKSQVILRRLRPSSEAHFKQAIDRPSHAKIRYEGKRGVSLTRSPRDGAGRAETPNSPRPWTAASA